MAMQLLHKILFFIVLTTTLRLNTAAPHIDLAARLRQLLTDPANSEQYNEVGNERVAVAFDFAPNNPPPKDVSRSETSYGPAEKNIPPRVERKSAIAIATDDSDGGFDVMSIMPFRQPQARSPMFSSMFSFMHRMMSRFPF